MGLPVPTLISATPANPSVDDSVEATKFIFVHISSSIKGAALFLLRRSSRRLRLVTCLAIFITLSLWAPSIATSDLQHISLSHKTFHLNASRFNASRVALLIENRPNSILSPLILHFMSVVPPEWRFRFMGSIESVDVVNSSHAIRDAVRIGKLDLTYIPDNMTTNSQEEISRFLTNLWLYETVLQPAEHLLIFQTDSMLCANSEQSINAWLDYDWVGAPWNPNGQWGGNGGLSLRKVSSILDVLRNHVRALDAGVPEDVWLAEHLAQRPGAKMANGTISLAFSGEMHSGEAVHVKGSASDVSGSQREKWATGGSVDIDEAPNESLDVDNWREGYYEPIGYHTGDSGRTMHRGIWGTAAMRRHIWDYCPEVKMIFDMDAEEFVPGSCNGNWKRDSRLDEGGLKHAEIEERELRPRWDLSNVDEDGYPYLPAELMAW